MFKKIFINSLVTWNRVQIKTRNWQKYSILSEFVCYNPQPGCCTGSWTSRPRTKLGTHSPLLQWPQAVGHPHGRPKARERFTQRQSENTSRLFGSWRDQRPTLINAPTGPVPVTPEQWSILPWPPVEDSHRLYVPVSWLSFHFSMGERY